MADREWTAIPLRNGCVLPLVARDRILGILALGKGAGCLYTNDELEYLGQVLSQVAVLIENELLHNQSQQLKQEFSAETTQVDDQLPNEPSFEEIAGRSPALQRVLRKWKS